MNDQKDKIDTARKYMRQEIVACTTCCSRCDGDFIWTGPHTEAEDLLLTFEFDNDSELNQQEQEAVFDGLVCPNCGAGIEPWGEVQYRTEYDKEVQRLAEQVFRPELVAELERFAQHLKTYPYLGTIDKDGTGRKICEAIRTVRSTYECNGIYYRARLFDSSGKMYSTAQMGNPDPAHVEVPEGRYNHFGQSFLYLADNPETALRETSPHKDGICVIQKYQLRLISNILDFRTDYGEMNPDLGILPAALIYGGMISEKPNGTSSWKPEYFVPRFIADVARYWGYSGIIFTSVHQTGNNLVLFHPPVPGCDPVGSPYPYWKNQ